MRSAQRHKGGVRRTEDSRGAECPSGQIHPAHSYWGQTPIWQNPESTLRHLVPPPRGEPKARRIWALTQKLGRNALIELSHQMLATQDITKDIPGAQLNWTYAQGGLVPNQIPERAQAIYAELDGRKLLLHPMTGGGTDAGYASLSGKPPVPESMGLPGWGYHAKDEFIEIDAIVPRLYLTARMLQELAKNPVK